MDTLSLCAAESFEQVMEFYMPMVYRIAFTRLANRSDAEDVTQDVFLRYFRAGLTYQSEEHRKAWLIRCAVNCANTSAGSAWNRHRAGGDILDNLSDPDQPGNEPGYSDCEENYEKAERRAAVMNAVMRLPDKYRTVIHLFYYEDMSIAQISDTTGLGESTVKSQLSRARKLLKPLLRDYAEYTGEVEF